jgi:hypothetical protein
VSALLQLSQGIRSELLTADLRISDRSRDLTSDRVRNLNRTHCDCHY